MELWTSFARSSTYTPAGSNPPARPLLVERLGSNLSANPSGGWLALAAAVALGIGHALAPGHGKTLMAAYLVGRGGTWQQASLLGTSGAISHTVGVGVLRRDNRHRLEHLVPGVAAAAVTVVGVTLLWQVAATWS